MQVAKTMMITMCGEDLWPYDDDDDEDDYDGLKNSFGLVMVMIVKMITIVWRRVASVTTLESGRVTRGPLTQHEHTLANTNTIERQAQIKFKD